MSAKCKYAMYMHWLYISGALHVYRRIYDTFRMAPLRRTVLLMPRTASKTPPVRLGTEIIRLPVHKFRHQEPIT